MLKEAPLVHLAEAAMTQHKLMMVLLVDLKYKQKHLLGSTLTPRKVVMISPCTTMKKRKKKMTKKKCLQISKLYHLRKSRT